MNPCRAPDSSHQALDRNCPGHSQRNLKKYTKKSSTHHASTRSPWQLLGCSTILLLVCYSIGLTSGTEISLSSNTHHPDDSSTLFLEKIPRQLNSDLWQQIGADIWGEGDGDNFGYSVDMNAAGDRVIIGGPYNSANGQWSGNARIFQLSADGTTWVQLGTDIDGDDYRDLAALSVAMNDAGDRVVIGIPHAKDSLRGTVRIYQWQDGVTDWVQLGSDIDGGATGSQFGFRGAVDINGLGNRVIAGEPFRAGQAGSKAGIARIFELATDSSDWVQLGPNIEGSGSNDENGYACAMNDSGDRVVVSSQTGGHYRVFELNTDSTPDWVQVGSDINTEGSGDRGSSVDINNAGDRIIVGSEQNDGNGSNAGHARIFQQITANGGWVQVGNDIDGITAADQSGYSVAMNDAGDRVIVGAYWRDGNGNNSGHARIFDEPADGTDWVQVGSDIEGEADDRLGHDLGMNAGGDRIIVGAPGHRGHARIYEGPTTSSQTQTTTGTPTGTPTAAPSSAPTTTPTVAPTSAPTITPAQIGSFDIHGHGEVTAVATSHNTVELIAPYNASNREHSLTVLSPNCIDPFTGTAATAFTVTTSEDESLGNGFITFNNTIEVDISKMNGTEWFKDLPSGDYGGVIDLCLEAAVFLSINGVDEKMNFVNTNVTLTVEMDASFDVISIDADRKDATKEDVDVDYSEYIEAYQCDSASPDTPLAAPLPTYSQEDVLTICVRGTEDDVTDVDSIKSLVVSQTGGTSSPFTYVTNGSPVSAEISTVVCGQGTTDVCVAELLLLGRFFSVEDPGDLTISGEVVLDFGGGTGSTTTRLLGARRMMEIVDGDKAEDSSSRGLQSKTKDDDGAEFDLVIRLSANGSSAFSYGTTSTIFVVSTVVAMIGATVIRFP